MPSSPRPAVQRHSGQSRHHAPGTRASFPLGCVRRAWPWRPSRPRRRRCGPAAPSDRQPLPAPRSAPAPGRRTGHLPDCLRRSRRIRPSPRGPSPSFSHPPSPVISAGGPASRRSEAPGPGPERLGRRGRHLPPRKAAARRPPSHGRAGTPSPPPEPCDYQAADARPLRHDVEASAEHPDQARRVHWPRKPSSRPERRLHAREEEAGADHGA